MRRLVVVLAAVVTLLASGSSAAPRQLVAGLQANWKDLETWSNLVESSSVNELGLGLQPTGGAVIAFLGRLSVRDPLVAPTTMDVQLAVGYMSNPNRVRVRMLTFVADSGTKDANVLDLSEGLRADDNVPGGNIRNAIGQMRAMDFVRLASSKTLTGNILGFEVVYTAEQLKAMRVLATRLHLRVPAPAAR